MENLKYKGPFRDDFFVTSKKAKKLSETKKQNVEFEFNGAICIVNENTNLDNLYRHYNDHWLMQWDTVGPICPDEYSTEVQLEKDKRQKVKDAKEKEEHEKYIEKERLEREDFANKTKGINIELANAEKWDTWVKANSDPYGGACVEYAECWAKLMQAEINKGETVISCAERTSFEIGYLGITGFMYGAAVQMLSQCWKHGEELRKWHNKEYGHEGDGVVNPAILTLK